MTEESDKDLDPAHFHRRQSDTDAILHAHHRLDQHEQKIDELLTGQAEIISLVRQYEAGQIALVDTMAKLNKNATRIAEVLDAWSSVKGFWTTLKFISAASKIVAPILLFIGGLYAWIRYGSPPPR